jgi:hypothetical protein
LLALSLLILAAILSGCGNDQVDSSATMTPPPQAAPNVPASGPALSDKLSFDQLAFDSSVKRVETKQGVVYLHFSYTDRTGKVYKCELPEAQSKGSFLRDEWLAVFNAYRLPTVIKTKAPPTNPLSKGVTDFPFISPRPGAASSSSDEAQPMPEATPAPPAPTPSAPSVFKGRPPGDIDTD